MQATLYMLDSKDLDSAMLEAGRQPRKGNKQAKAEAEQRERIQEPDRTGRNKDVGGNVGHEEQAAGVPNGRTSMEDHREVDPEG